MRKMGLKIARFTIHMLIYIKFIYSNSKTYVIAIQNINNLSFIPLNIENNMISLLFLNKTLFLRF